MKKGKWKNFWKTFWFIVWKDDSFKGWIISILFLFIVVKLIFFPVLELTTGTELPLVIVESCSMHHNGNMVSNFDNWWDNNYKKYVEFNITKQNFEEFQMKKGFTKGDILFVVGKKPEKIQVGDIIIFEANYKNPIIHRVIEITQTKNGLIFSTLGDNNQGQLISEKNIAEAQIVGKASLRITPYLGWIKLIFFEKSRASYERGFCN